VNKEFSTKHLAEASVNVSKAYRQFGIPIGRKYIQRIAVLRAAVIFSQLYGFQALKLHPLKGNREGQYAITLTGNYRLILEKVKEDLIRIVDMEDYHGD